MRNTAALERVAVAMARLPNVLETQVIANQKTLEQKISEQGPREQRVDPHLLGLAIKELTEHRRIITKHHHAQSNTDWYSNSRAKLNTVSTMMDELGPLYSHISTGDFPNRIGEALEIVTERCLMQMIYSKPRLSYSGHISTDMPKTKQGRFARTEPPESISGHRSQKLADFHLHGLESGPACIECKNYREWIYPRNGLIKDLIKKSTDLRCLPILVARRIHYTTMVNLFVPAGIVAHETYNQYYPEDETDLAERVRNKRTLGFTDVVASYEPSARTSKFFNQDVSRLAGQMGRQFLANRGALTDYANGGINLAQLYTAIKSPAGGKWNDNEVDVPF